MSNVGRPPRPLADRFWEKVQKTEDCWIWTGAVRENGYGAFQVGVRETVGAHRMAFELASRKSIPDGFYVMHRCDNPTCVRPDHLCLGTASDNMQDMVQKGRSATGDKNASRRYPGIRRGEQNGNARLTAEAVVDIRRLYAAGNTTQMVLAERFHVSQAQIQRIVAGTSWRRGDE